MSHTAHRETIAARDHGAHVRVATDRDASDIASIYNHYVDIGGATFDNDHWTTDQVIELLNGRKPTCWLVAVDEDVVIGWSSACPFSHRYGYRFSCETAIYLTPASLGRGVGDALQVRLEQHCRECGIHHAVARIIADNERSMAFHRRYGYELVGIQKEIGHMNDQWADVAILQKIF